jgi:SEC-C motif-containing protein
LPLHEGAAASSPEALMRSRYAAYATARVGYLVATTHPDSPHRGADTRTWAEELRAYCAALVCEGLTVHEAGEDADGGYVAFTARLRLDGRDVSFRERSRFRRVDGRWTYLDGEVGAA